MQSAKRRTNTEQADWLIDQVEVMQELHQGEIARLQKELRIAQADAAGLRLVIQSAYLALRSCKGLEMAPHTRDRVRGALVATARCLGIKPADS